MSSFSKMATTVAFVVLVAFAGVIGKTFIQKTSQSSNVLSIDEALRLAANAVNETAPVQIDKDTRLMNAVALNRRLRYRYSLSQVSAKEFENGSITKQNAEKMRNSVCSAEGMKALVKLGTVLEYAYYDKDGVELEVVFIDTAKCTG